MGKSKNDKSTIDENTSNGGLGFIGSHVVELQNEGFEVVVDDLSNTSLKVLDGIDAITGKIPAFEKLDLRDRDKVQDFFKRNNDISGVIHFAASKAVGESVENPLLYYENNVSALVYVLQELQKMTEANFILVHLAFWSSRKNADY
jgi:UDP-glucose 4-epimerase